MRFVVRPLEALGPEIVFAPERWVAGVDSGVGVPLGELVVERRERAALEAAIILDTTHARDGVLDLAAATRGQPSSRSAKKLARVGDLAVSRLRPYLRQIAYVHPAALAAFPGRPLALSTEFYVLGPRDPADDLAWLVPFLLGARVQGLLAAAQEGGHHPRVPRSVLLDLRVPERLVRARRARAAKVLRALGDLYAATLAYQAALVSGDA